MNAKNLARTCLAVAVIGLTGGHASAASSVNLGTIADGDFSEGGGTFNLVSAGTVNAGSPVNIDGTEVIFNFNEALTEASTAGYGSSHFFQVQDDQFRLEIDMVDGFHPVDHLGSGDSQVTVDQNIEWAITGNNGARTNSIFRGNKVEITQSQVSGGGITFSAKLITDGLVHWYGPTAGEGNSRPESTTTDDPTNAEFIRDVFGWADYFVISGSLSDPGGDANPFGIYESGGVTVEAVVVPTPAASAVGLIGFGLLAMRRRRRGQLV